MFEQLFAGRRVRQTELHPAPIFIIGHWQSGHSLVHACLSHDEQFGYLQVPQSVFPAGCLSLGRLINNWIGKRMKNRDRGSDNMKLSPTLAQGNDLPMALWNGSSFYHAYGFPSRASSIFERNVLMNGRTDKTIERWKSDYLFQMKKTALISSKTRLIIRNASDTARIPQLISMFPNAKFVHVVRDPFEMIPASLKRW